MLRTKNSAIYIYICIYHMCKMYASFKQTHTHIYIIIYITTQIYIYIYTNIYIYIERERDMWYMQHM